MNGHPRTNSHTTVKALVGMGCALAMGIMAPSASAQNPPPAAAVEDIRGLRGPIEIPAAFPWLQAVLGSAMLLVLAYAGYRFWSRRRSRQLTAHERAFEALTAARKWIAANRPQELSFAVSGALRSYLEERFELPAMQCTTKEFLERLADQLEQGRLLALQEHEAALGNFLRHVDIVKFARGILDQAQMEGLVDAAWQLVEESRQDREPNEARPAGKGENDDDDQARREQEPQLMEVAR